MKTQHARWLMTDEGWLRDASVEIDDAGLISAIRSDATTLRGAVAEPARSGRATRAIDRRTLRSPTC